MLLRVDMVVLWVPTQGPRPGSRARPTPQSAVNNRAILTLLGQDVLLRAVSTLVHTSYLVYYPQRGCVMHLRCIYAM